MNITDLRVHILTSPLDEPFYFSQGWVHQRSSVIVEIQTDEGITGWGECLCHGLQPPEIAGAFIRHAFAPLLIGRNPFDSDVLWEEMYNKSRPYGQGGAAVNAISGIDIALWDIKGKACGQPVSRLLGGMYRQEVMPYATGFYRTEKGRYPEDGVEEALRHKENGLRAMKLKIGFGIEEDLALISAVREAIGPDVRLMADANGAYNAGLARRLMLECREQKLYFLEELLAPEDQEGYLSIRHLTGTLIAAGENLFGKTGYRSWISQGALDILQPDLCSAGGFTECRKIAAMAQAWNTMVIPHVWGSGIGLAASLQFIATLAPAPLALAPEEPMLEYDQSSHPFRAALIHNAITLQNGMVAIPTAPGLGVEINRDIIEQYGTTI
ncbi:mandelate racemase/muconate lactonizing enzyme family protein [Paenibacillus sp. F411]|uniref:mandelate racemase/muconate lactonizing enzyme family protein n=1 Tax=unclassified Paenibacillus TaxID=185978 RepID=UPI001AAF315C|nr:mandelate racemase/muconate lactonizing enzyme family protein [Paenibacillus sp. F411]MBO2945462.1 mandelate racemase/muconate lactonizing enzyme family protein [Paenibacillus sp. F411]